MKELPAGFAFRPEVLTFAEAVEYFDGKVPVTPEEYNAMLAEYKLRAFTMAAYTEIEAISQIYEDLLDVMENGGTMEEFREQTNEFLERRGYVGLTSFQADNIFRTNVQTAYQVGHYRQMTKAADLRPYWMYVAVGDSRTRPEHMAMDGRVYDADSPVWDTWYPPNGFRCRCTVVTLSRRQVEQRGLVVESKIPYEATVNGKRIRVVTDNNFGYNPATARWDPDLRGCPESMKKVFEQRMKEQK